VRRAQSTIKELKYWSHYTTTPHLLRAQVVQVCAEHKKPRKLLKHLDAARAASQRQRHPPRCLIFTNKVPPVSG
jgi:selenocysteine lyase/cysteine desulfurase